MENLFHAFTLHRRPEESFLDFSRRHNIAELKAFCIRQEA
jgi:hypothetical protein